MMPYTILLELNRSDCRLIGLLAAFLLKFEITSHRVPNLCACYVRTSHSLEWKSTVGAPGGLSLLCEEHSGKCQGQGIFKPCMHAHKPRRQTSHLLDTVSCWITKGGRGLGRERRHQGMFHLSCILLCLLYAATKHLLYWKPYLLSHGFYVYTQNSDIDSQNKIKNIPAVYREGAEVACLFHPREPEVVVDQYLADIDAAIVVICSWTLWL